ncbi:Proteinase-activated receptor 3 [Anabarilius grahami]|uniref:Proteinase-activated receptor 3 n=1 Tax=Anabarilius grahami TaxID=495550 RepID=A0A3N0Z0K4_ANAGA|nr:Proteinase-activated receptor 3 [Anabarilius grahami]
MGELTNASTCVPVMLSEYFRTCSNLSSNFIAIALSINLVLGLPPNCYILWLTMKEMIQGQSTKTFVFSTALVEIFFCASYVFVIPQHFYKCIKCELGVLFLGLVLLIGRPLFQSCICVERYIGVLHPVTFLKFKPMKYRIVISITGWILTICLCILVSVNVIGLYNLLLPGFLFFFSIKLFTCLMVLKALLRPGPGDDIKKRNGVNRDKLKAFWIIVMVLVSSVLTYGPSTISLVLYYFIDWERFLWSWSISMCLGLMSGFVQPILYLKRVGKLPFC